MCLLMFYTQYLGTISVSPRNKKGHYFIERCGDELINNYEHTGGVGASFLDKAVTGIFI